MNLSVIDFLTRRSRRTDELHRMLAAATDVLEDERETLRRERDAAFSALNKKSLWVDLLLKQNSRWAAQAQQAAADLRSAEAARAALAGERNRLAAALERDRQRRDAGIQNLLNIIVEDILSEKNEPEKNEQIAEFLAGASGA